MVHAHIYRYIATEEANGEFNTFIIRWQTVNTQTYCVGPLCSYQLSFEATQLRAGQLVGLNMCETSVVNSENQAQW